MRSIMKNPSEEVPSIHERDIKENLIMVVLKNGKQIAYCYEVDPGRLNWYGDYIDSNGYPWFWTRRDSSLIEFLMYCWSHWESHGIKSMHVVETPIELKILLNQIGVPCTSELWKAFFDRLNTIKNKAGR